MFLAIGIGEMFLNGELDPHMCQAESLISCFTTDANHVMKVDKPIQNPDYPEGHSFGMLLYEKGFIQGAILMNVLFGLMECNYHLWIVTMQY
jgi:hypothetical protein